MKLTKDQIEDIIEQYIQEVLKDMDDYLLPKHSLSQERIYNNIEGVEDVLSMDMDDLVSFNYKRVYGMADGFLQQLNIEPDKDSHEYRELCHGLLKARVGLQDIEVARAKGNYGFTFPYDARGLKDPKQDKQTPEKKTKGPTHPLLKDLVKEWKDENTQATNWKPRTINAYNGHFNIIVQILGEDLTIDQIDHPTVRGIKDTLLKLPTGMNKKKAFMGKSVAEILTINETEQATTMSISTVNRYLITLGAFFKWCVGNGHMDMNYAEGKKIKVNKRQTDQIRDAFSTEDLNTLFQAPGYTEDTFDEPYKFWLPILGLYTGARLNEICQLRLADIQTVDGIYSFVFQEDSSDSSISMKTASSKRTVPIHPFVADDLNLKGYVNHLKSKGETRLFPELPFQNENYGHKASKWFGVFRKSIGIDSPKKVYHSFRHTLTDNLKQQLITETVIDELTGHAVQGETMGRYGKKYRIDVLYNEAVLKLDYEIELDHLKNCKYVEPKD